MVKSQQIKTKVCVENHNLSLKALEVNVQAMCTPKTNFSVMAKGNDC